MAIEGLGAHRDRTIFTAQLQSEEEPLENIPAPRGKAIMVNTLYSPQVALDALAFACAPDRLGILALTKSLCSTRKLNSATIDKVLKRHPHLAPHLSASVACVRDFVTNVVLPNAGCILIMNEAELEHLTGERVGIQRRETYLTTIGGVVEALRKVRAFQRSLKERVYVTLGSDGAVLLTENDKLVYCGVIEDKARVATGKTAIGDTYATFNLALETIG